MSNEDLVWLEHRARFANSYDEANYESPLQSFVMKESHRLTERPFSMSNHFGKVLEVGSGTGEHLNFVKHTFDQYVLSDMDSKMLEIAKVKLGVNGSEKIKFEKQNGEDLNFPTDTFDRVIAAHVLEHIYQPHLVLKEWSRVIRDGGTLSVLIPTDPGLGWRLGRHLGPRRAALKKGLPYDYLMAREHVNSCTNLIALLRHYFPVREESWWPLKVPSVDLNLFFVCHATIKKS